MRKQTVRIIGGRYRGKKISFPALPNLRPTPDRVRETVFNWLMPYILGARCLDAFAGSGALGFEAYSRGASRVVLVDAARGVYLNLKATAEYFDTSSKPTSSGLSAGSIEVLHHPATVFLQCCQEHFDIVFLDPPFTQKQMLAECLDYLVKTDVLAADGLVYIESSENLDPAVLKNWQQVKISKAGQVHYGLYQKLSDT